jgi:hypothetical protein
VQPAPSLPHGFLVSEVSCRRRAAGLDERGVRPVAQLEQVRVDPPTLAATSGASTDDGVDRHVLEIARFELLPDSFLELESPLAEPLG